MSTDSKSPLTYAEQAAVRKLREIADETEKAYLEMHRRMDEASGTCQAFEPYPLEAAVNVSVPSSGSEWDIARYKATLEAAHEKSLPVRERNAAVAANNRKLQERFMALVQNAGIPTTVRRLKPRSRSRWNNYETVESDWFTGLKMAIPTLDCWSQVEERYKQRLREIATIEERKKAEKAAEERAKAAKEAEVRKAAVVLNLSEKYGCQAHAWDVGKELFKRCKYLRLAHYLRKNRGDWSDGPDYEIPTGTATGACFEWSYDALFALVDADLFADYEKWHAVASDD